LFSPPVDFTAFEGLTLPAASCLVVYGDQDGYCTRASLEAWLAPQPTRPTVVSLPGGDHFYFRAENGLKRAIGDFLKL
jgi:alpha/beta superfamily hydrolase